MENKTCGECKKFGNIRCGSCEKNNPACIAFEAKITNGDKIRQMSDADLAELLVYETIDTDGFFWYTSNILDGVQYEIIPDAIAATLEKLNEVAR